MNGISLFNGMGGFSIACQELGITFDRLYTSEVDKHCLAQTRLNFPNEIEIGDVRTVDVSKLDPIDIIVGGSPCQCFSFAGKRKGMSTTDKMEVHTLSSYLELKAQGVEFEGQSYLFWEYMRILKDLRRYNPKVLFLLENVEMGKKWEAVLTRAIGVEGVHINSALVCAQNRRRIYWTNIAAIADADGNGVSTIPQPEDRCILLRDILENDVDEKYYLSDKMIKYFNTRASNFNAGKVNIRSLSDKATTLCKSMSSCDISDNFVLDTTLNPKKNQDKASCFTAGGHSGGNHSDMDLICVAMRGRNPDNPSDRRTGSPTEQVYDSNGIFPALMTEYRGNIVVTPCDYRHDEGLRLKKDAKSGTLLGRARNDESCGQLVLENIICPNTMPRSSKTGKGGTGHLSREDGNGFTFSITDDFNTKSKCITSKEGSRMDDKFLCISSMQKHATITINKSSPMVSAMGMGGGHVPMVNATNRIRRLTPMECARLQTIPEWYRWNCSNTQQYRMLGNGWTIEVIKHILSYAKNLL